MYIVQILNLESNFHFGPKLSFIDETPFQKSSLQQHASAFPARSKIVLKEESREETSEIIGYDTGGGDNTIVFGTIKIIYAF